MVVNFISNFQECKILNQSGNLKANIEKSFQGKQESFTVCLKTANIMHKIVKVGNLQKMRNFINALTKFKNNISLLS